MSKSISVLGATAVLLASTSAWADKPRIAVTPVAGDGVSQELRERVAQAVAAGLVASGADVRTEPALIAYRVRGTLDLEGRNYKLHLEIVDVKTGEIVDTYDQPCDICTEREFLEAAGIAASALKSQVFKRRPTLAFGDLPAPAQPRPAPPPAAAPQHGQPAVVAVDASSEKAAAARPHAHRALGVAGIAAGAMAGLVGGWLLSIHHEGTCDAADKMTGCTERYNTAAGGTALVVGGGLALVAGVLAVAGVF
jgi:hypothetical protein